MDVARACLERIDAWEPKLNAMYRIDREGALAAAKAAEARWRAKQAAVAAGRRAGHHQGKHLHQGRSGADRHRGQTTTRAPQPADAPPAARLREAGCVILGKTTMPDFGMLSSGLSSIHGVTRNPVEHWTRNTSGSSSGAGAAAAAGYAPLHLGTDIGGSVRLPATHCGIFALKPSLGRVPVYPPYIGRVTGPMTRDVAASAALMNLLSKPDARDFMSLPFEEIDFSKGLEKDLNLKNLQNRLPARHEGRPAGASGSRAPPPPPRRRRSPPPARSVEQMPSFLTEELVDGMCRFFEARSYNDYAQLPPAKQAKVLPFIVEWSHLAREELQRPRRHGRLQQLRRAARRHRARRRSPTTSSSRPTSPILPYEAELPSPNNDPHNALPHIAFTVPYNMSEQPAASLNWTFSKDGLPIGIQVIGRRFDDLGVLRLSRALEQMRPAQKPWPAP